MIPSVSVSVTGDTTESSGEETLGECSGMPFIPPQPPAPAVAGPKKKTAFMQPSSSLSVPTPGGVFPLPNSQQIAAGSATGNPRNKVALRPGYSLMDWIRLTKSGKDLTGTAGRMLKVTKAELRKHRMRSDAWMAINGKVYNVTAYMEYHPGGWDELMRGVGIDATDLFNEVHRWVNYESMLVACLVGKLIDDVIDVDRSLTAGRKMLPPPESRPASQAKLAAMSPPVSPAMGEKPVIPPIVPRSPPEPSFDFYQTETTAVLSIFTRRTHFDRSHIIAELIDGASLRIVINFPSEQRLYQHESNLSGVASLEAGRCKVFPQGKVEIVMSKSNQSSRWPNLGETVKSKMIRASEFEQVWRPWVLADRKAVTHDVDHLVLERPPGSPQMLFSVPIGHHVQFRGEVAPGVELERSYTPVWSNMDKSGNIDDGKLHFLVKTYSGGTFTPMLKKLGTGDILSVSNHMGDFETSKHMLGLQELILLPAGTGLTPMVKVLTAYLRQPWTSKKKAVMLFFNKTEEDIMWRGELEAAAERHSDIFQCHHVLSQDPNWSGSSGRVSRELLAELLPAREPDKEVRRMIAVCGPILYMRSVKKILSEDLKYDENEIVCFEG